MEKKNPGINPGQPVGKGLKKKTLVLTLGSPPEKGEKKNPGINLSSPLEKGEKKEKEKSPGINLGSPSKKGEN